MDWRHDNLTGFEGSVPPGWNELTRRIIGAAMEVHRAYPKTSLISKRAQLR